MREILSIFPLPASQDLTRMRILCLIEVSLEAPLLTFRPILTASELVLFALSEVAEAKWFANGFQTER